MPVTQALIDGSGWHLDRQGWKIVENYVVSEVGAGSNPSNMIPVAYQMLVSFGVDINFSHAIVTTAFCTDIEPAAIANNAVTFRVTFKEYEIPVSVIEVGNSVAQVETDKDKEGDRVLLQYTYPDDYKWNADLQGEVVTQPGLLPKIMPEPSISITRREVILGIALVARKLEYEGKVNSSTWALNPASEARTWLCTGIGGRSQDNGLTYDVTYTFQYREDTWDETARFVDAGTGQTPSDIIIENKGTLPSGQTLYGARDVKLYKEIDFNGLELGIAVS